MTAAFYIEPSGVYLQRAVGARCFFLKASAKSKAFTNQ